MADDRTPSNPDADQPLPEPDESPFFGAPAKESGESSDAEPSSEAEQPGEPQLPPPVTNLEATQPHDFGAEMDSAAEQPTQLLPTVQGIEVAGQPAEIPPFDAAMEQPTQLLPAVAPETEPAQPAAPVTPSVSQVIAGSRVVVLVSRGPSPVPPVSVAGMPHVVGLPQGEALEKLQEAGLSAQVFNEYSELPRGEVIAQMPPYGQSIEAGSEAVLLVSGGPSPVEAVTVALPNVVGLSEADALAKLQGAGLSPQVVRDYSANTPLGVVVDQLPNDHAIAEAPRKKLGLWWLWTLLVVAILVAIGGGVYYYLNRTAAVPNLVGLSQAQAEQAITAAGFKLGSISTTQTISASDVGKVVTQKPAPNTQLKLIDQVNITVSGGQKLFAVPDVTSKPTTEAESILASAGLVASTSQAYSSTVPKDSVISQSPGAGEKVPSGTTIGLTVSLGQQNVTVPGVGGQSRAEAVNSLKAANLSSQAVIEYTLTGTAKGQVFSQYPTAGMLVAPGTIVGILVSNGSPASTSTVSVPSVVGEKQSKAQKSLSSVTLGNIIINWSGTGRPKGEVVGQAPEAGSIVPKKVAAILFVSNGK